jgi:hypothetical protein
VFLVNVDADSLGITFSCSDVGLRCLLTDCREVELDTVVESCEDNESLHSDDDDDENSYVAVCDRCGTTHIVNVDFMGLGLEFTCAHAGAVCQGDDEGSESGGEDARRRDASSSAGPILPPRSELKGLTLEEKRSIFDRHALQRAEERAQPKQFQKGVQQLFLAEKQKERYRDNEIVTRKGERFIKINISLDPGPGCEIGGILGWRSKAGRKGLGIRKMTKEEADRVCISNKTRAHVRKATGPGGFKQGYLFENKWSQHTEESFRGSAVGPQSADLKGRWTKH